jgi:hypothetical protein
VAGEKKNEKRILITAEPGYNHWDYIVVCWGCRPNSSLVLGGLLVSISLGSAVVREKPKVSNGETEGEGAQTHWEDSSILSPTASKAAEARVDMSASVCPLATSCRSERE